MRPPFRLQVVFMSLAAAGVLVACTTARSPERDAGYREFLVELQRTDGTEDRRTQEYVRTFLAAQQPVATPTLALIAARNGAGRATSTGIGIVDGGNPDAGAVPPRLPDCPGNTVRDATSGRCGFRVTPRTTSELKAPAAPSEAVAVKPAPPADDPNAGIVLRLETNFDSWRGKVMFAFASSALSKQARANLGALVAPARKSFRVDVVGRTDASGDAQRNERLALGRALAVRDYFVDRGVPREKFFTAAVPCTDAGNLCGEHRPDGKGMRRVDIGIYRSREAALQSPLLAMAAPASGEVGTADGAAR